MYSSFLSSVSILYFLPAISTPPSSSLMYSKYAFQPFAICENAAVRPDCGKLETSLIVSPSISCDGSVAQFEVSIEFA